jgi:hypothetical protein
VPEREAKFRVGGGNFKDLSQYVQEWHRIKVTIYKIQMIPLVEAIGQVRNFWKARGAGAQYGPYRAPSVHVLSHLGKKFRCRRVFGTNACRLF